MASFIYVFSKEAYYQLVELCYQLIAADDRKGIFIFLNQEQMLFSQKDFPYVLSDTLTF